MGSEIMFSEVSEIIFFVGSEICCCVGCGCWGCSAIIFS